MEKLTFQEKNTVLLNLLKPQKSASRLGEKQILTNLGKKKVNFPKTAISGNGALVQARAQF